VRRRIGVDPAEAVGTIHAFYFATADRKARLMGARHVEMAKPWLRQIYVTHEAFPHPSLRHEIAHVVAGRFGDPWFGVAARRVAGLPVLVNPGLIEGLAVALDWPGSSRSMTPHQSMRAMELLGYAPSADDVFSVRFMTLSSARGYTAAGSFLRFLLDTYGPAPVRAVYRSGGDFAAAFGKPQAALVAEWRAMLATVEVPAADLEAARERFRGKAGCSPARARTCWRPARGARRCARLARGDRARGDRRLLRAGVRRRARGAGLRAGPGGDARAAATPAEVRAGRAILRALGDGRAQGAPGPRQRARRRCSRLDARGGRSRRGPGRTSPPRWRCRSTTSAGAPSRPWIAPSTAGAPTGRFLARLLLRHDRRRSGVGHGRGGPGARRRLRALSARPAAARARPGRGRDGQPQRRVDAGPAVAALRPRRGAPPGRGRRGAPATRSRSMARRDAWRRTGVALDRALADDWRARRAAAPVTAR
jgi:hypothetical protein